jgi:DNA-binding transcriptional regulator YbjK
MWNPVNKWQIRTKENLKKMASKRISKKKMVEKATEAVAKTEEAAKTVVERTEEVVKTMEAKFEENMNKPEVKEAAAVVKEAVKSTAADVVKETKEQVKTAAKTVRTKIVDTKLEINGMSVSISEVEKAVKKAVADKGLKGEINIYLNVAEQAAYYTVNGEGNEEQKVLFAEM